MILQTKGRTFIEPIVYSVYHCKNFQLKNPRLAFVLAIAWFLVLTWLLCLPGSEFPKDNWLKKIQTDKWVHIVLFFLLILTWCRAYAAKKNISANLKNVFTWISITGFLYGIVMELVQHYFVAFRSFEAGDIIADGVGCIGGYLFSKRYIKK